MRIPSQFNEESLYRRGRRRDESSQNYRRLARLVIGLALVIVVMRQSSRPEIYRTFFAATAVPAEDTGLSGVSDNEKTRIPAAIAVDVTPRDRSIANHLVKSLVPSDQRQWVAALSRWQSGRPVVSVPSTVETVVDELAAMELADDDRVGWRRMIESFTQSTSSEKESPTPPDRPRVAALLAALDAAASSRVVDGSVWRSGDFDLFYRYLDQAAGLSANGVAATGVIPLLQQPDVFRNQTLRVHGTVARVERIPARENVYDIESYWQLWLRPADGADRPIIAILPNVPPSIQELEQSPITEDGPIITVVGKFLKRLAYESSIGADLAPVVIGRLVWVPVTPPSQVSEAEPTNAGGQFWALIFAAVFVGFALAAVTMWRTSVMARRSRELRVAHRPQPDGFLNDLRGTAHWDTADESTGDVPGAGP